jgi:Hint domain
MLRSLSPFPPSKCCFLDGTLIATTKGEQAVETLKEGDLVLAVFDAIELEAPVRFLGRRRISAHADPRFHPAPIRIRAGALGELLPRRDLLVSSAHALYLDDVLVQAGAMVNGVTIIREEAMADFTFFHVELDRHALLFAEGVLAESFVDDVDRMHFDNWDDRPVRRIEEMDVPRVISARQMPDSVHKLLRERAEALGYRLSAAA